MKFGCTEKKVLNLLESVPSPGSSAGGLDDGLDVLEGPLGLGGDAALDEIPGGGGGGGGVEAKLAGHKEQSAF